MRHFGTRAANLIAKSDPIHGASAQREQGDKMRHLNLQSSWEAPSFAISSPGCAHAAQKDPPTLPPPQPTHTPFTLLTTTVLTVTRAHPNMAHNLGARLRVSPTGGERFSIALSTPATTQQHALRWQSHRIARPFVACAAGTRTGCGALAGAGAPRRGRDGRGG